MAREDYMSWKTLLRVAPQNDDLQSIQRLWAGALELLTSGERDWQQRLPQDLVDEKQLHGYEHIQALLSMRPNVGGNGRFVQLARPFLMVISHPALLDCLSVDVYVGDLYNFISGSGGARAIPFFQSLTNSLVEDHVTSPENNATLFEDTLLALATALREVLRRTHKAIFHEDLPTLVESIRYIDLDTNSVAIHTIKIRVAELHRMISRAQAILVKDADDGEENGIKLPPVLVSTFPRDIQPAGDRHDNDKRDITEIDIVPTEGEVRSERPEFLPSPDTTQPHYLVGIERLFDTHFRLLRHDIWGELKSTLGGILNTHDNNPELAQNLILSLGNMHAHAYQGASVRHLKYSKDRGLEAQISFPLPHNVQKKSLPDQKRWWEDNKRLEEGSLLCLLTLEDQTSTLLFFTVSHKTTDPRERHGLTSGGYYATISASPASGRNQRHLETLIELSLLQGTQNILVEFPGVLLATFFPILENLQQMQRASRLPFENWILSNPAIGHVVNVPQLRIPPSLYARGRGFVFDLRPILKDSTHSLALSPTSDDHDMPRKLEQHTTLDRGQCEALIAALTREFALIQGPPGTGKSYLGIKIMQVLIANKKRTKIGPIVVV